MGPTCASMYTLGFLILVGMDWSEPLSVGQRSSCSHSKTPPPGRVDTSRQLKELRTRLLAMDLDAFIITRDDEHQSEFPASRDRRIVFISGFSGSDGYVVVTREHGAALWTDGRYFIQADVQLSCDWLLMRTGQQGVPHLMEWIVDVLPEDAKIGADPKLTSNSLWNMWERMLENTDISLVEVFENPVDRIWNNSSSGRPSYSKYPAYVLSEKYTGRKWEDKVKDLRARLAVKGADAMVVTALDEVAWLLNIRGYDVPYNPMVHAFVVVTANSLHLYVNESKLSIEVKAHLKTGNCYYELCAQVHRYDALIGDLKTNQQKWKKVLLPSQCVYSPGGSRAVYSAIPPEKQLAMPSPIIFMKARKNRVEIEGMRRAHIRDAVAVCDFLAYLEESVSLGNQWNELNVSNELDQFRREQNLSRGPSFPTVAAFGANGAAPHYLPMESSNVLTIDGSSTLLMDSGGHYLDGTTDVTRTIHLGTPTDFERETYTRVLIGSIQLASLVFPYDTPMSSVDVLARGPLWEAGLNYLHGTGHGVGAFLSVHESPIIISYTFGNLTFQEGYFFSDEPGYYHEGHFGIRLENVLEVVRKQTKHHFSGQYYSFRPTTYVPYEPKLIDVKMLSPQHRQWLNDYNAKIRTMVGTELLRQRRMKGFYWMMNKTGYISDYKGSSTRKCTTISLLVAMQIAVFSSTRL
ncbi:xaa-Pro aminopeptidase 1-like isoform X2 [Periplaneta americana]|uniref:xaa-Pro aminopeptidase 1-like isoform X2 n=1 Tax=Periplaneta americana TaxID=6978 RepID=UPI0037E968C8